MSRGSVKVPLQEGHVVETKCGSRVLISELMSETDTFKAVNAAGDVTVFNVSDVIQRSPMRNGCVSSPSISKLLRNDNRLNAALNTKSLTVKQDKDTGQVVVSSSNAELVLESRNICVRRGYRVDSAYIENDVVKLPVVNQEI